MRFLEDLLLDVLLANRLSHCLGVNLVGFILEINVEASDEKFVGDRNAITLELEEEVSTRLLDRKSVV